MTLPLCLGIDPGKTAAIALVEPRGVGLRPVLLLARVIPAAVETDHGRDAWASYAYGCFEAAARASTGRRVVARYELTIGSKSGALGQARLHMRRGLLLGIGSDAGAFRLADAEHFMVQTWTSILGIPGAKQGDGWHRIEEAERLIECAPDAFRGLGPGGVDAAEAVLMAAALSRVVTGEWVAKAKKPAAKKRRAKSQGVAA